MALTIVAIREEAYAASKRAHELSAWARSNGAPLDHVKAASAHKKAAKLMREVGDKEEMREASRHAELVRKHSFSE